ncbi:hypothetical protein ACJJTC_005380 [Scirpophaga incertulas]
MGKLATTTGLLFANNPNRQDIQLEDSKFIMQRQIINSCHFQFTVSETILPALHQFDGAEEVYFVESLLSKCVLKVEKTNFAHLLAAKRNEPLNAVVLCMVGTTRRIALTARRWPASSSLAASVGGLPVCTSRCVTHARWMVTARRHVQGFQIVKYWSYSITIPA